MSILFDACKNGFLFWTAKFQTRPITENARLVEVRAKAMTIVLKQLRKDLERSAFQPQNWILDQNRIISYIPQCSQLQDQKLVTTFVLEFFKNQQWIRQNHQTMSLLNARPDLIANEAMRALAQTISSASETPIPSSYSDRDKAVLRIRNFSSTFTPQQLSCHAYSLLTLGVSSARRFILQSMVDILRQKAPELIDLETWGFTQQKTPQRGDLIAYCKEDFIQHLGIYVGNGVVQSKLGYSSRFATLHRLEDAPASYGGKYLILRRTREGSETRSSCLPALALVVILVAGIFFVNR